MVVGVGTMLENGGSIYMLVGWRWWVCVMVMRVAYRKSKNPGQLAFLGFHRVRTGNPEWMLGIRNPDPRLGDSTLL